MRAIFQSKFKNVSAMQVLYNESIITSGKSLYREFLPMMDLISELSDRSYISIPEIYAKLQISPYTAHSKRKIYEKYSSGVVVGAGAGEDCTNLINNKKWSLFDLQDTRMILKAVGYKKSTATVNIIEDATGNTIVPVRKKRIKESKEISVTTIDSLDLNSCDLISADVEGAALDILVGAIKTLRIHSPDLLISIYHNWIEYLHVIPFLYDQGYNIQVLRTSSDMAQQPQLELSVLASK